MTEYQNWPSALRSRATIRAQRGASAAATCADFFGFSNVVIMAVHFEIFGLRRSSRQHRLAALRLLLSNSILPRTLCSGATADHLLAATRTLCSPYIAPQTGGYTVPTPVQVRRQDETPRAAVH